jgi:5-methylcytosine-specific restriction endonuclease McrA
MSASKRRRVLDIIATDATFERTEFRGREVWLGKCLHCNAHLMVDLNGDPISRATIEHIIPRTHGGTDALENLGLACARCNQGKGTRHDPGATRTRKLQMGAEGARAS